jgi:hypothetical protein
MRTTVTLAKDVAAAVQKLQRQEGVGVSEALNRIARAGIATKAPRRAFRQRSANMGPFAIDVSNVADALEVAEGADHR